MTIEQLEANRESITRITNGEKINFVRIREDRPTEFVYVQMKDPPRSSFGSALKALVPVLIEECGLNAKVWNAGEITTVFFIHSSLGRIGFGATIQVSREGQQSLSQSLPRVSADDVDESLKFILQNLIDEAWIYIKGGRSRKQLGLFDVEVEREPEPVNA